MVGNCGSVVESDLYIKLKKLDLQEEKKDKSFADYVTQVCEAHDRVMIFFHHQVRGPARTCEANHRGIEGEHWAQCARVRR